VFNFQETLSDIFELVRANIIALSQLSNLPTILSSINALPGE
jgi:hypothetical protein